MRRIFLYVAAIEVVAIRKAVRRVRDRSFGVVQVGGLVEVLLHCLRGLLGGGIGAVLRQVIQQVLQGLQLLADLVVAVFQDGDWLVVAGGGIDQGIAHGASLMNLARENIVARLR